MKKKNRIKQKKKLEKKELKFDIFFYILFQNVEGFKFPSAVPPPSSSSLAQPDLTKEQAPLQAVEPSPAGQKRRCGLASLTDARTPPADLLRDKSRDVQDLIRKHWVSIKNYSRREGGGGHSVYNMRIMGGQYVEPQLDTIFSAQSRAFKINVSVGLVLRNRISGEFRYFLGCNKNNQLFPAPFLVQNRKQFQTFVKDLLTDFTTNVTYYNSSGEDNWVFHDVTNLTVYVNNLDYANVCPQEVPSREVPSKPSQEVPSKPSRGKQEGNKRKKGALEVNRDRNARFFYCLAAHENPQKVKAYVSRKNTGPLRLKREMKSLLRRYTKTPLEAFGGVTMADIGRLEQTFNLGIQIYTFVDKRGHGGGAYLVRRANPNFKDVMHLDISNKDTTGLPHFKYIHDLKAYAASFRCGQCLQPLKTCARNVPQRDSKEKKLKLSD